MEAQVEEIRVGCYTIPTDSPESDGTLEWDATTLVIVEAVAGGRRGLGYTYADQTSAVLIQEKLANAVLGRNAMDVPKSWSAMVSAVRNLGRPGICSTAIAAVDTALWDLKARLLDLPLVTLLGACHDQLPVYGSGGFTSYSVPRLQEQLSGWAEEGLAMVKMKVGRQPAQDLARVAAGRKAVGESVRLFVDANGAYTRKQALDFAERYRELEVSWFEEPVISEDLEGLHWLREQGPPGMEISAGEYGYELAYFHQMLEAGAVDVLQVDITRCAGLTELIRVGALCAARGIRLSCHTAPSLHLHPACAVAPMIHLEYFYDHVRIERMLFDGVVPLELGFLRPDRSRAGHGLEFKFQDAKEYAV